MGSDSEEKKMVLRLKEILPDRSEQEICEMLKECGMDPDEAVQRLLSQDTFHEVKSKREKRKKKREQDIKSSVSSGVLDEGWNFDHEDGRIIVQSDPDASGRVPTKRENATVISSVAYSSSAFQTAEETYNQQSMHNRDSLIAKTRGKTTGTCSPDSSSSQPPTRSEPCDPVFGIEGPLVTEIVGGGSLDNGSLELTETSLNNDGAEQAARGHSISGNLNSFECSSAFMSLPLATNDVTVAHHEDGSHEQMTLDGENIWKKGSQEAASDVPQVSYLGELLSEQTLEDAVMVILPSHLQALAAECSHLSLGTYKSKSSSTATGIHVPRSLKIDSERLCISSNDLSSYQLYTDRQIPGEMHQPTLSVRQQPLGAAFGKWQIPITFDLVSPGSQNSSHGLIREQGCASSFWKEVVPRYSSGVTLTPHTFPAFEPSSQASCASHRLPNQLSEQTYSHQADLLKKHANLNVYPNTSHEYGQIPFCQSPGNTKHGLPQYKRDDLQRNLAIPNYDSLGSRSTWGVNALGDFQSNSVVTSNLNAIGYNDVLQNQILKDTKKFPPHGFSDHRFIGWDYRAGSGAIFNAQENAYYNILLEQERNLRDQQDRQYRNYGSQGNSSSYHSQVGSRPDNQLLQRFGDMTLNNPSGTMLKPDHLWQQKRC